MSHVPWTTDELSFSNAAGGCPNALPKLCTILHNCVVNVPFSSSFLVDFLKIPKVFLKVEDFKAIFLPKVYLMLGKLNRYLKNNFAKIFKHISNFCFLLFLNKCYWFNVIFLTMFIIDKAT